MLGLLNGTRKKVAVGDNLIFITLYEYL